MCGGRGISKLHEMEAAGQDTLEQLIEGLYGEDEPLRIAAAYKLGQLGARGIAILAEACFGQHFGKRVLHCGADSALSVHHVTYSCWVSSALMSTLDGSVREWDRLSPVPALCVRFATSSLAKREGARAF